MNMSIHNIKDQSKKSVGDLEEQLRRQTELLKNIKFVEKLPDKGAKLKVAVQHLENVIKIRKAEEILQRPDATQFEWVYRNSQVDTFINSNNSTTADDLDSDDDDDPNNASNEENVEGIVTHKENVENDEGVNTLEMLATSQISQRLSKTVVDLKEADAASKLKAEINLLGLKLSQMQIKNNVKTSKFKPNANATNTKALASPSKVASNDSASMPARPSKYYECLFPLKKLEYRPTKLLTFEESLQVGHDAQLKEKEAIKKREADLTHKPAKILKTEHYPSCCDFNTEDDTYFTEALEDVHDNAIVAESSDISEDDEN